MNQTLRDELIAMRTEDLRVREELVATGELGGRYIPRMEAVHVRNAQRLKEIVAEHGWPDEQLVSEDGAEAAWLIVQHAIGSPGLQRECLPLLRRAGEEARIPRWHAAYPEDRIAMQERRPQRYGTQWLDDPIDGRIRPWKLADPARLNELRAEVGLQAMHPIPQSGPELPVEQQKAIYENQRWWQNWLSSKGWRD